VTFQLPPLPYAADALGIYMSAETLDYHHGRHHRAYVDKVNALAADRNFAEGSLVELIREAKRKGDAPLFNNAAQHWNHSFFWQCLAPPDGRRPTGRLAELIDEAFGGTDAMLARLHQEAVAHFGSGWAWLVLDGGLKLISLHDADTPVAHEGMKPLLTLDLWEHAYYIDWRNERPRYAQAVLGNIIDWEFVASNLDGNGASRADQQT
jgi:Fe-Mn family superoxide dismutase